MYRSHYEIPKIFVLYIQDNHCSIYSRLVVITYNSNYFLEANVMIITFGQNAIKIAFIGNYLLFTYYCLLLFTSWKQI